MSVTVGWSSTKGENHIGTGVRLFEYLSLDTERGRGTLVVIGYLTLDRADLLMLKRKGVVLKVRVVGVLRYARDVTDDLIAETIHRV
jgi:hypothetical protein